MNERRCTDLIELASKERRATILAFAFVRGMVIKKLTFKFERNTDRFRLFNVPLSTIDHRYISKAQWNNSAC